MTEQTDMRRSAYAPVIERLEKADGQDRELDMMIFEANGKPLPTKMLERNLELEWDGAECAYLFSVGDDMRVRYEHPHYTASLDAAIALAKKMLPGWTIARIGQDDKKLWHAELRKGYLTSYSTIKLAGAVSPAIALLIAMFRALEAQEEDDDDKKANVG